MTSLLLLLACAVPFPNRNFPANPQGDFDGDGMTEAEGDCDDIDAGVLPTATETCDGKDNDCDGALDDGDDDIVGQLIGYVDLDGDGYGNPDRGVQACDLADVGGGLAVEAAGDCNDDDGDVNPGAVETCGNGVDDDCDGSAGVCGWDATNDLAEASPTLSGSAAGDNASYALAGGADADGDGRGDLAIGVPNWTPDSGSGNARGRVAVLLSSVAPPASGLLDDLPAGVAGDADNLRLGTAVAWTDIDGDGASELAIGVPSATNATRYSGGAAMVLRGPYSGEIPLEGAIAFTSLLPGNYAGRSVSDGGSLAGAGTRSVIVGTYEGGDGAVHLLLERGAGEWPVEDHAVATVFGPEAGNLAFDAPARGDLDGDGVDDLVVGAAEYSSVGGAAALFYGPLAGAYSFLEADIRLLGATGSLGRAVDLADVDGDGALDLLVGDDTRSVDGDADAGAVIGLHGSSLSGLSGDVVAWDVADFVVVGSSGATGCEIAHVGDVDSDGHPDLAVGARRAFENRGAVYLLPGPFAGSMSLIDLAYAFRPPDDARSTGIAITPLGDYSGDGLPDFAVGAPGAGSSVPGQAFVLLGNQGI